MSESVAVTANAEFPHTLEYGQGLSITAEDLVAKAALLNSILGSHLNEAARNDTHRRPLTFPELNGLHDLASTLYYALAENVYHEQVEKSLGKDKPAFI